MPKPDPWLRELRKMFFIGVLVGIGFSYVVGYLVLRSIHHG